MKTIKYIIFHLLIMSLTSSYATTWSDAEAIDPISGEKTAVKAIMSYGSYVYRWSSKFDGVIWPVIDENYIRLNKKSGYIAFGPDFEKIDDEQKAKVTQFLKESFNASAPLESHLDKVIWLERVYIARGVDAEQLIKIKCLLCYLTRNDIEASNVYRKSALKLIQKYLKNAKPSPYVTHLQIVAGFYSMLLGNNDQAKKYFTSAEKSKLGIENPEEEKGARKYFDSILEEIRSDEFKKEYYRKQG